LALDQGERRVPPAVHVQICSLLTRHSKTASTSHAETAVVRITAALWCGRHCHIKKPNAERAILAAAAPRAPNAAANRPRIVRGMPARRFLSRSFLSINRVRIRHAGVGRMQVLEHADAHRRFKVVDLYDFFAGIDPRPVCGRQTTSLTRV
jgi:hypothetical protein